MKERINSRKERKCVKEFRAKGKKVYNFGPIRWITDKGITIMTIKSLKM